MKRFLTHPLLLSVLAIAALYVLFAYAISPPMPRSLLIQFMAICVVGVFLVVSFDDATFQRFLNPLQLLLGSPGHKIPRALAFVVIVAGASALTYTWAKPSNRAPIELRTVHPAPPSSLRVFGNNYNLATLQNPLRETMPRGSDAYVEMISEGGTLYYENCIFCHGDNLDGQGHIGDAFNPRPANFQDVGTIAQLQESYLFWRIATGAPGLPREGAPWASAMPVWHEILEEEQIWKIVSFLYDYTGYEPRSWELEAQDAAAPESAEPASEASETSDEDAIRQVYDMRCAQCHGEEGEGDGPAAELLYPKPRDFSLGTFKYKTSAADSEFPYDADIARTIRDGLPGTSMPAWGEVLSEAQITGLVTLLREFGDWAEEDEEELGTLPMEMGTRVESSAESIARGAALFEKACLQCHGADGRGNVTSGKVLKDDWQDRIWPRNLTRPETWRWTKDAEGIFQRISGGIRGTPMPEHTTTMSEDQRWDIANYAMTLRDNATPLTTGDTVIRALRVEGDLPDSPDDPAWDAAPPITFPFAPNVIKGERLYFSLNDTVTVRAMYNDGKLALRVDIDDRTYSVPGAPEEVQYRDQETDPAPDAAAVQFPIAIPTTSERPWFRHGDPQHGVNMWYWRAPNEEAGEPESNALLDASGPDGPPTPRADSGDLVSSGSWEDGRWRIVFSRSLDTEDGRDLQFETGRYIPVAFANWDGWAGHQGSRHSMTSWYWLLLEEEEQPLKVYGVSGLGGALAALAFLFAARRQRRAYEDAESDAA